MSFTSSYRGFYMRSYYRKVQGKDCDFELNSFSSYEVSNYRDFLRLECLPKEYQVSKKDKIKHLTRIQLTAR